MSTLFARRTELIIGSKTLQNPPLEIAFEFPFSDDEKENTGSISVYNLSKETLSLFKKGSYIILRSGYKGDIGTISTFTVKEIASKNEGVDKLIQVTVGEEDTKWKGILINQTWRANILGSQIITDIISYLGLTLAELNLPRNIQYPRGKVFSKQAKLCLQEVVKDCGAVMIYTKGKIYIRPPQNGINTGFVLNKDTGLIGSPELIINEKGEKGYRVISLLNYRIGSGSIIKLESKAVSGFFKVSKGMFISNESEHVIEMEVVPAEVRLA